MGVVCTGWPSPADRRRLPLPQVPTVYEVLEELAITVQQQMNETRVPFCAFNGAPPRRPSMRASVRHSWVSAKGVC